VLITGQGGFCGMLKKYVALIYIMNEQIGFDPRGEYTNTEVHVKSEKDIPVDLNTFKDFDYKSLPKDGFMMSVISARRGGKSFMINYLIQQFQQDKELAFSHIFLISETGFGFKGIPPAYRFGDTSALSYILKNQEQIRDYNRQQDKPARRMRSRILIVVDDCACNQTKDTGMKNQLITKLALNGRHYSTKDPVEGNGVSVILISQALKNIPKGVRLNQDVMFANNISSLIERNDLLDENFYIDTTMRGKRYGRKVFQELSTKEDFVFIAIENHIQNKRKLEDYIRVFKAQPQKEFKFFGGKKDWVGVDPFD